MIHSKLSSSKTKITNIETTNDLLADRGGLLPLLRYLDSSGIVSHLAKPLLPYRTGNKGVPVEALLRQVIAFLFDGTSRHLTRFDQLKQDPGYRALIETPAKHMVSSDQIERFFNKIPAASWSACRKILRAMFSTRLRESSSQTVELFLDTMVMDNDDAQKRQGCQPTYKKVKGFQPLQLIWDGMVVDAQFRGGKKHGNHGQTAFRMIEKAVKIVREIKGDDVPIIVRVDAGFFDGELYQDLSILNVAFVATGRLTEKIKAFAEVQTDWKEFENARQAWSYFEFGTRCQNWDQFYRAIYLRPVYEDDQRLLEFARPDQVIVTNLGSCPSLLGKVDPALANQLVDTREIISQHHRKGANELTHRSIKEFGFEQLPFKKFQANTAMYYLMVIAFNLFQWFQRDVLVGLGLVKKGSYANTVRRKVLDFAAKIVATGRRFIMKVTQATMSRLRLEELWERSHQAPILKI